MEPTSYVAVRALREVKRLEGRLRTIKQELIRSIAGTPPARTDFSERVRLQGVLKGVVIEQEDIEAAKRSLFRPAEYGRS